jgi:hypothetical protein
LSRTKAVNRGKYIQKFKQLLLPAHNKNKIYVFQHDFSYEPEMGTWYEITSLPTTNSHP